MRLRQIWDMSDRIWIKIYCDSYCTDGVIVGGSKKKYLDIPKLNARRHALFLLKLKKQSAETRERILAAMARLTGGAYVDGNDMIIIQHDKICFGKIVRVVNI